MVAIMFVVAVRVPDVPLILASNAPTVVDGRGFAARSALQNGRRRRQVA